MTAGPDGREIFSSLRASTVQMLGYTDVDQLSPVQEIRVARTISLRLIVDAAQAKQLRGEAIDVRAFTDASESLERLVGGDPEKSDAYDFSHARRELEDFLTKRAAAIEHREQTESSRLRTKVADLTEENERLRVLHACSPAQPQPLPPPRPDNVVAIDAELKRLSSRTIEPKSAEREAECAANAKAFRDSYSTSGTAVCAPGWSPPSDRR